MSRATPVSTTITSAVTPIAITPVIYPIDTQPAPPAQTILDVLRETVEASPLPEPRMLTLPVRTFPIQLGDGLNTHNETIITHTVPEPRDQSALDRDMIAVLNAANSLEALQDAAWSGDVRAQFELGTRFYLGSFVDKNYIKAFKMFNMAAKQGSVEAQFNVGVMYELGLGVSKDEGLAAHWFRQAANQGNSQAQANLGMKYNFGDGVEQNDEKAVLWDSKAAEQGHAESQFNLAFMYQEGRGVQQSDTTAARWYRKAADQGFAKAQCNLGVMYEKGEGIEKDESKAIIWYTKAAQKNNKDAQFNLIENYIHGQGIKKDLMLATYFLLKFGLTSSGRCVEIIDFVFLLDFFPSALNNFSEFKSVQKIIFRLSELKKDDFFSIAKLIRQNTRIEKMSFHGKEPISESDLLVLTEAIVFNTILTELKFNSSLVTWATQMKFATLLKKNSEIIELREYMKIHPILHSNFLPLEVLALIVDQMIIASLKSGQSKKKALAIIEKFLSCASIYSL